MKNTKKAFSLVELSIVLIIIGLLVAAVTTGSTLIKQAKLRTIINDIENYKTAYNTFWLTYEAIPGDMPNAYEYFGTACGADAIGGSGINPVITDNCNGDGDLQLTQWYLEVIKFWQHLSLAELIKGSYTGMWYTSDIATTMKSGLNVPAGPISGSLYYAVNMSYGMPGNRLRLVYGMALSGGPALNPAEAHSIDRKIDDGMPISGKLVSYSTAGYSAAGCSDTQNIDETYNLTLKTPVCKVAWTIRKVT
jgi:prepilin-type N-terminal cleavage/methylation domain-containing protein